MNKNNKRKRAFANNLHKEIFWLVFIAALVPAAIVTALLYYLIFNITAEQMVIPEAIAYNLIPAAKKVIAILLFSAPACIVAILFFAYKISHRIIGPFDRIVNELDKRAEGREKGPILIRKNDKFKPLVDKINKLLDRLK